MSNDSAAAAETIADAAREHVAARGEHALVDAYAVFLTASPRGSRVGLAHAAAPALAEALAWLDEELDRPATKAERLVYAWEMRAAARDWTTATAEDAVRCGEVSIHLTGALRDDDRRDWGTSCSLPPAIETRSACDRARLALAHEIRRQAA